MLFNLPIVQKDRMFDHKPFVINKEIIWVMVDFHNLVV